MSPQGTPEEIINSSFYLRWLDDQLEASVQNAIEALGDTL